MSEKNFPDIAQLLKHVVAEMGGQTRSGQLKMAEAVENAVEHQRHLLVQAGTGTGKSLAYLLPLILHAEQRRQGDEGPAVVSTATLALQSQIVARDLPRAVEAAESVVGYRAKFALLKGRNNYLCKHKLDGGYPEEPENGPAGQEELFGSSASLHDDHPGSGSGLGLEIRRLREWAAETTTGDRDELKPGVSQRAWQQVSVSSRECLGASSCPMAAECFSEKARAEAQDTDIVVTNHALLAINAFGENPVLPEHDLVVIDEAHELVDRVTSAVSIELNQTAILAAASRARKHLGRDATDLDRAAMAFAAATENVAVGLLTPELPPPLFEAVCAVRDEARALLSQAKEGRSEKGKDNKGGAQLAKAALEEVFTVAERIAESDKYSVLWLSRREPFGETTPREDSSEPGVLHMAPLSVAGVLRSGMLSERTVVATSATLTVGDDFHRCAGDLGLLGDGAPAWASVDVGSPFSYQKQGILYVAKHLPEPKQGISDEQIAELGSLIKALDGRTLGLFSSMRAAQVAAERLGAELDVPILCQGEDTMPNLVAAFATDPRTCLFGTMTLWQGVDVPGDSCQLVAIDRIPFPRPDDPLVSARTRAVAQNGGNGFMTVSATHAAIRMAQGAGRLIRTMSDRGVVAVLDSRLAKARYGAFVASALPPFWRTDDGEIVRKSLSRLAEQPVAVV